MVSPAPSALEQSIPLGRDNLPAPVSRLLSLLSEGLGLLRCQSRFQRWKVIVQRRNESPSQCRPFRYIGSRHVIHGVFTVLTSATQLAVAQLLAGRFRGQRGNLKFRYPVGFAAGAGAWALLVAIASSYVLENLLHLSSLVPVFAPSVVATVVTAAPRIVAAAILMVLPHLRVAILFGAAYRDAAPLLRILALVGAAIGVIGLLVYYLQDRSTVVAASTVIVVVAHGLGTDISRVMVASTWGVFIIALTLALSRYVALKVRRETRERTSHERVPLISSGRRLTFGSCKVVPGEHLRFGGLGA